MANYSIIVNLASLSGETADNEVNTFAFQTSAALNDTVTDTITGYLLQFYTDLRQAGALRGLAQNGHTVKFYNAVTTTPNYPLFTKGFNLPVAPGAIDLPLEIALCISYSNDSETTVPARRRRGRIYVSGFGEADNTAGRPTDAIALGILTAYVTLVESIKDDPGYSPAIWSRSNGALYDIERVWVDNEWDTMRSRGGKSTARQTELIA